MNQSTIPYLGTPRFGRFLDECTDDHEAAVALYEWDLRMSGATYEAMHIVEIVMRNAIDAQLKAWNRTTQGDEDWLLNPHVYLLAILDSQGDLEKARTRASKAVGGRREPRHEDVLAQMSFGSWRFMLPSGSNVSKRKLWDEALVHAFPHWYGEANTLVVMVDRIYRLRNRLAHLEPIYREELRARRKQLLNLVKAIDPTTHSWFKSQERMLDVIESRPEFLAEVTRV